MSPVVALIIGFIFWGETLSVNEMAGAILIILGIAVIS
ncbi:EamA family transporter [Hungatella hathewayi]